MDHEDVGGFAEGVDPGLGAVGAAVAEGARGECGGGALGLAGDAPAEGPGAAVGEAGFEVSGGDGGHELDGFGFEEAFTVEGSFVEDHLGKAGIVGSGGEESAVGGGVAGAVGDVVFVEDEDLGFGEGTVFEFVGLGEACFLSRGEVEGGIGHTEGAEEAVIEEGLEGLAGDDFDDSAEGVDAGLVVFPPGAGDEAEGAGGEAGDEIGEGFGGFGFFGGVVGEAGGVGEEVADGDLGGGAIGVFEVGEFGDVLFDGVVDGEKVLFDEHHDGGGGDGLGHGGDPEDVVGSHGGFGGEVGVADGAAVGDALGLDDDGDGAGDLVLVDVFLDGLGDGLEVGCGGGAAGGDEGEESE